ncbi:MAG TPA: outer membrane beta-barrel protein, partial [Mucilaginibacter sp.]
MKKRILLLSLFIVALGSAFAQTATKDTAKVVPPTPFVSMLGMAPGPLTITPEPVKIGSIYISGVASALALAQTSVFPGDKPVQTDISNAQIFIQKIDGVFQFFIEVGGYSLPALGAPYLRAGLATNTYYGLLPQGFIKIAPSSSFSIEVGKLPTLIGAEYTFSFENMNIQRGLLWNQENAVNRGVQLNYTAGPLTLAVAYSDGLYSNNYNWILGSLTYAINSTNTLAVIGGGSTSRSTISTPVTPLYLNNEQIYNLIYTHTSGQWTVVPYLQYTSVPASPLLNTTQSASTFGAAVFVSYAIPKSNFTIPVRFEYINSTGSA